MGNPRTSGETLLVGVGTGGADVVRPQRHRDVDGAVSAVGGREDPPVADDGPSASGRVSAPKVNGQMGRPGELVGLGCRSADDPRLQLIGQSARDGGYCDQLII